MPKMFLTILLAAATAGSAFAAPTGPSQAVEDVRKATEWIAGVGSRVVGSEEHKQVSDKLLEQIEQIDEAPDGGLRIWQHTFDVVVPRTKKAELLVGSKANPTSHKVYPFWPAAVRLHSTPRGGISGKLIYVKRGELEDIPAKSLRGQIAVMEMSAGKRWRRAVRAGARAVILLGDPKTDQRDAASHLLPLPVYLPRFYVPGDSELAAKLRAGSIPEGTLVCESKWEKVEARNIYALVKPKPEAMGRKALAICVPIDAMSVVPDLAPGADVAVDAAMGLTLLRHFTANPPARPVLVGFLDAQSINILGVRHMAGALSVAEEERADSLREDNKVLEEYEAAWNLVKGLASDTPPANLHEPKFKPIHTFTRDEVDKVVVAADTELQSLRVLEQTDEVKQGIAKAKARRSRYRGTQVSLLTGRAVSDEQAQLARELWALAWNRTKGQYEQAKAVADASERRRQMRNELTEALGLEPTEGKDKTTTRPIGFMLGLDLSDAGMCVGPQHYCRFLIMGQSSNARPFQNWVEARVNKAPEKVWPDEAQRRAVNLRPFTDLRTTNTHTQGDVSVITPVASFQTYSMTWATLNGYRRRVDTPFDQAERLDWSRLGPQIDATISMLDALTGASDRDNVQDWHKDFHISQSPTMSPDWVRVRTITVDVSPGTPVPRLPMEGYLTALVLGPFTTDGFTPSGWPLAAGMRRYEFHFTGPDGRALFQFIPRRPRSWLGGFHLESYQLDDHGAITRAIDLSRAGRGVKLHDNFAYGHKSKTPFRGVVFSCTELTVAGLQDPRYLMPLPNASLLDARSQSAPKRMNMMVYDGLVSCLLEPKVQWQLVLRAGITRNRMALLNMGDPVANPDTSIRDLIEGFRIGDPLPADPLYQAAKDWHRLNERRISDYAAAGITSAAINEMHAKAGKRLGKAKTHLKDDLGDAFVRDAGAALATEARVYQAVLDTANDVVRGAVLMLLLLMPFAAAMERLMVAAAKIVHQIVATLIIFVIMTGILWSFHPAFKISAQPLTVIMAFGIIFMSLLVIVLVLRKFESELAKLRSGRAESSSAKTSRLGVLSTAIRLSIANMRRRKLRTVLTGMTVVLITFALLCFVSTSQYSGYRQYALDQKASFTGVLIRQTSSRPLPAATLDAVRNCLIGVVERDDVVGRMWWSVPTNQWRLNAVNPNTGKHVEFSSALGLDSAESNVSGVQEILPHWGSFAAGGGCYVARQAAKHLGVERGDRILVAGQALKLVDVFDSDSFDVKARDLDRRSLAPLDYTAMTGDELTRSKQSTLELMAAAEEAGAAAAAEQELRAAPGQSVLILPQAMLEDQRDCTLQSVAIHADDAGQARAVAERLADRFAFSVIHGAKGEPLQVLASTPLLPSAPKSLLIPLIIGASIIFNTMLSSIAERRREVYIYTSLGLAPIHVGFLFLAEAMTYGLMGSVFGYVVGQGAATALDALGWLGGMTLNYSGSQAIMIMFMVLVVVMVAALIPAYLAGRMAAPSNKRTWAVPEPVDGVIRDTLPFTVNAKTANGVAAYLLEYLDAHAEGSIGHFSTDKLTTFRKSVQGLEAMGIEGTVWLAPYDLGVRQEVRLTIEPADGEDIYGIHIELRRASGSVRAWHRLNRVFLGDLRRQLLGWRRLEPGRILEFLAQGRGSLAAMPWVGQAETAGL